MTFRLCNIAGDWGPLGFTPRLKAGWGAIYNERPTPDTPSVDETIKKGLGFCLDRGCGTFLAGELGHVSGYQLGGAPAYCDMRGPGALARFDEGAHSLDEFVRETRLRTDASRAAGLESAIYLGMPNVEAFNRTSSLKHRRECLKAWTWPIMQAGFDRVMIDAAPATVQVLGEETPTLQWAEHLRYQGIGVDIEGACQIHPGAFAWFNGRFGHIMAPSDLQRSGGPGWFNGSCRGCVTRTIVWMQGSEPAANRRHAIEAGVDAVVEVGGL